jgi:hypothetical protein
MPPGWVMTNTIMTEGLDLPRYHIIDNEMKMRVVVTGVWKDTYDNKLKMRILDGTETYQPPPSLPKPEHEPSDDDDGEPEQEARKESYEERLHSRLRQLTFICFGDGAARGYGKCIGGQFSYLLELRKENPEEHDRIISSDTKYEKLYYDMFPGWHDVSNLQRKYEKMDRGVFAALTGNY